MHVEIITPQKKVFNGNAKLIQLPGKDGSFEILENHASIVSVLKEGQVRIVLTDNSEEVIEINGGVLELNNNKAIILAE